MIVSLAQYLECKREDLNTASNDLQLNIVYPKNNDEANFNVEWKNVIVRLAQCLEHKREDLNIALNDLEAYILYSKGNNEVDSNVRQFPNGAINPNLNKKIARIFISRSFYQHEIHFRGHSPSGKKLLELNRKALRQRYT